MLGFAIVHLSLQAYDIPTLSTRLLFL